jgi:hypothetical protein
MTERKPGPIPSSRPVWRRARAFLRALQRGLDAVVSNTTVWLLCAQEAEAALRASEVRCRDLVEGSIQG